MKIVNVLATGKSLRRYIPSDDISVGVHKIVLYHKVNHLLFVDRTSGFPKFVIDQIRKGYYDNFYTLPYLYDHWKDISTKPIQILTQAKIRGAAELDSPHLPISISSSFAAVGLAYRFKPDIIDLYGADFVDHPTFNSKNIDTIKRIKKDFQEMQKELLKRNVTLRVTPESCLSEFLPLIPQSRMYQGNDLVISLPRPQ